MKPFTALLGASAGTHAADQLALATLPLTATLVMHAGPETLGLLVAAQSAAWLLLSLPAGAWIDRYPRRMLLVVALGCGLIAALAALVAAVANAPLALAAAAFVGAAGTVIYVLTSVSLLPTLVASADLSRANARLELARACASLAAPFVAGLLAQHLSPTWGYVLAAMGAALAVVCVLALPKSGSPAASGARPSFGASIKIGAAFVLRHELLRGISLCAIFWNFAFFALLAIWAPLALGVLKLDPAGMGLAQSALGAGLILGALAAPHTSRLLPPLFTLIFGPVVSVIGVALFVVARRVDPLLCSAAGFFLIGFGPMLWAICQTTVRQLVTPLALQGRVNATVQTANYGVRPLGALAAGTLAAHAGVESALMLVAVSFALSTLVIVVSPLARLRAMPEPARA
ncbi:MAG: MFS transporter [Reyranellales bacterium]